MAKKKKNKGFGVLRHGFFDDNEVLAIGHGLVRDRVLDAMVRTGGMADLVAEIDPFFEEHSKEKRSYEKRLIKEGMSPDDAFCEVSDEYRSMPTETMTFLADQLTLELTDFEEESIDDRLRPGTAFKDDEQLTAVVMSLVEAIDGSDDEMNLWNPYDFGDDEEDEDYDGSLMFEGWRGFSELHEKCPYVLLIRGSESDVRRMFFLVGDLSVGDPIAHSWNRHCEDEGILPDFLRDFVESFDDAVSGAGRNKAHRNRQFEEVLSVLLESEKGNEEKKAS